MINRRRYRTATKRKTAARGYGWEYQKFRRFFLQLQPLCEDCKANDRVEYATEIHHKIKVAIAPHRNIDPDNVLALCEACHRVRTDKGE